MKKNKGELLALIQDMPEYYDVDVNLGPNEQRFDRAVIRVTLDPMKIPRKVIREEDFDSTMLPGKYVMPEMSRGWTIKGQMSLVCDTTDTDATLCKVAWPPS